VSLCYQMHQHTVIGLMVYHRGTNLLSINVIVFPNFNLFSGSVHFFSFFSFQELETIYICSNIKIHVTNHLLFIYYFCSWLVNTSCEIKTFLDLGKITIICLPWSILVEDFIHYYHVFISPAWQTFTILSQSLAAFETWMPFEGLCPTHDQSREAFISISWVSQAGFSTLKQNLMQIRYSFNVYSFTNLYW
jgi:hypothetical protein